MRGLTHWLLVAVAAYAGVVALLYGLQDRILYQPDIMGEGLDVDPGTLGLPFEDVRFTTRDGVTLHGWFVPAPGARRVVLHCHGNGGNISHRLEAIRILHELGLAVLAFDYRGYGLSGGRPSEAGTYRDVEAAWHHLRAQRGYAARDVILYGYSLGAAVVAYQAQRERPAALILESAFTSLPDVAAHHYWFLPARMLTRYRYPTVEYVRAVSAPVLVIHSRDDEIVPVAHGRAVFEAAREPKGFLEIAGGHAAGFLLSGTLYSEGVRRFIAERIGDDPALTEPASGP